MSESARSQSGAEMEWSAPDAEIENENQESLTDPFDMVEVLPGIFLSSLPTHLPSTTHTLNLTTQDSVGKNVPGGAINHWHVPIRFDGDFHQSLPLIIHAIKSAVPSVSIAALSPSASLSPSSSSATPATTILIYSDEGRNRAPAALLAYMCDVMDINVVEAFLILKKKKTDISPSGLFLERIQTFTEHGEKFEDVEKEILRRLRDGFAAAMKEVKENNWKYEAE